MSDGAETDADGCSYQETSAEHEGSYRITRYGNRTTVILYNVLIGIL